MYKCKNKSLNFAKSLVAMLTNSQLETNICHVMRSMRRPWAIMRMLKVIWPLVNPIVTPWSKFSLLTQIVV
uniref:Uncharacterized protein n=2 Tax=Cucumis melo TaxID=3656 RepID=A0A9I9E7Z9_CUCME